MYAYTSITMIRVAIAYHMIYMFFCYAYRIYLRVCVCVHFVVHSRPATRAQVQVQARDAICPHRIVCIISWCASCAVSCIAPRHSTNIYIVYLYRLYILYPYIFVLYIVIYSIVVYRAGDVSTERAAGQTKGEMIIYSTSYTSEWVSFVAAMVCV